MANEVMDEENEEGGGKIAKRDLSLKRHDIKEASSKQDNGGN
jgi:hypothetical protein